MRLSQILEKKKEREMVAVTNVPRGIYIYIYVCVCVCLCVFSLLFSKQINIS